MARERSAAAQVHYDAVCARVQWVIVEFFGRISRFGFCELAPVRFGCVVEVWLGISSARVFFLVLDRCFAWLADDVECGLLMSMHRRISCFACETDGSMSAIGERSLLLR